MAGTELHLAGVGVCSLLRAKGFTWFHVALFNKRFIYSNIASLQQTNYNVVLHESKFQLNEDCKGHCLPVNQCIP